MTEEHGEHTFETSRHGSPGGPPPASGPLPASIAGYRILGKLGEGGMGVVYEAEQQEPRRIVALKVIRGGAAVDETTVRMFQREVETLARLKHPAIGAIYESGRTPDGLHWFAMELVHGPDLAAFTAARPKAVTPEELRLRLRLVARIAQAVHYAHQRGVIHRDLKPSNIIVTEAGSSASGTHAGIPDVKILDFGLARMTDEDLHVAETLTVAGAIKGTLPYMSPEQARGDAAAIDVRTDVYALGVVLYELLTGQRPYDVVRASLLEAVRVICEEPPRSMSLSWSGNRKLDPDVETIVGKALEKDPGRRYGSAAAFAEDLERYLASQPILARPPSAAYQVRKFTQRHRALVLGAAATALAVIAGLAFSTALYFRAEREKKSAEEVATFLSSMLEGVGAQVAQGRDTALLRDILAKTKERIDKELGDDPEIEARLRSVMGLAYYQLADFAEAETQWNRAFDLYRAQHGEMDMNVAQMYINRGQLAEAKSDYAGAEQQMQKGVDIVRRIAPHDARTPQFESQLANQLINQARYEDARVLLEAALARQRALFKGPNSDLAVTLNTLGNTYNYLGKLDEAEKNYRAALEMHRQTLGDKHPYYVTDLVNTAYLLDKRGKLPEAEAMFRDALARNRELYPDGGEGTAICLSALSTLLQRAGKYEDAEKMQREAVAMNEKLYGAKSVNYARALDGLGVLLATKGDGAAADSASAQALAVRIEALGPRHPDVASSLNNLGMRKLDSGRFVEAQKFLEQAVDIQREAAGVDNGPSLVFMNNLARAKEGTGDLAGAEALFKEVIERRRKVLGKESVYIGVSEYYLSRLLRDNGRASEAEAYQREAAALMKAGLGDSHAQTFISELELTEVLTAVGKLGAADSLARSVRTRAVAAMGPESKSALDAGTVLGRTLTAEGKHAEALQILDETVAKGSAVMSEASLAYARISHGAALAASGRVADGRNEIEAVHAASVAKYGPSYRTSRLAAKELGTLRR